MVSALIDFVDAGPGGTRLRAAFGTPRETLVARSADEVMPLLDAAHERSRDGAWCIGHVRYEAARAFDPALPTHERDGPLAWFAVYDAAEPWPALPAASHAPMQWTSALERAAFDERIARIHQAIADGEVYQINLTAPLTSRFDGDALGLFDALHRAQPAAYAVYLDAGDEQLLSVSPELFFDWRDRRLLGRPMKGTAPRGATPEADRAAAEHLRASEKERAENLMIVDLIRNDVSRVAEPFSVQVPRLFHVQAWPTVWQMTSDVTARTRPGTRLSDVFRALFPCGSITGAPKRRAMHWIRELEPEPRGIYCGAIGVLQPGGAATFNVAIRSVVLRDGIARCGIGSGITSDAKAAAEWDEWRHKQRFLQRAARPFELLETLRLDEGDFVNGAAHVERFNIGAHLAKRNDETCAQRIGHHVGEDHLRARHDRCRHHWKRGRGRVGGHQDGGRRKLGLAPHGNLATLRTFRLDPHLGPEMLEQTLGMIAARFAFDDRGFARRGKSGEQHRRLDLRRRHRRAIDDGNGIARAGERERQPAAVGDA